MTKKEVLRCVAFLIVVCLVLVGLTDIFEMDQISYAKRFNSYRCFEKDTMDAVFIGTSAVARYWLSSKAYDEHGMTVYPLAIDAMPAFLHSVMVDEALAYQNPELLIFDTRPFVQTHTAENADVRARRVLDSMEILSVNRMNAALKTMEVIHNLDESKPTFDASYIFSFAKFHTQWADSDFSVDTQYDKQKQEFGGYFPHEVMSIESNPKKVRQFAEDYYVDLDPLSEESLYELLDHLKETDVQVLFVDTPKILSKTEWGCANMVRKIVEERGFSYISYNFPSFSDRVDNQIDPETDYYDGAHVNYYGAEKFTACLAAYLDEHYELPDRRNDEAVQKDWDGVYEIPSPVMKPSIRNRENRKRRTLFPAKINFVYHEAGDCKYDSICFRPEYDADSY